MSTLRQIEANRRNAQNSTGPRSVEGKAASRCNALKTGIHAKSQIIRGEDPAELETLAAEYFDQFQPATPLARLLVDSLVRADWQLRRLYRVEAQLWENQIAEAEQSRAYPINQNAPLGDVFDRGRNAFTLLQRRIDSTERSCQRAITQLHRIQPAGPLAAAPALPDDPPQPFDDTPPSPELASFSPPAGSPPSSSPPSASSTDAVTLPGRAVCCRHTGGPRPRPSAWCLRDGRVVEGRVYTHIRHLMLTRFPARPAGRATGSLRTRLLRCQYLVEPGHILRAEQSLTSLDEVASARTHDPGPSNIQPIFASY